MKQKAVQTLVYIIVLWTITTAVFGLYVWLSIYMNHFSPVETLINGTASRPYVYRVLIPFIVSILSKTLTLSPNVNAMLVMYLSLLGFSGSIIALTKIFLPSQYVRQITLLAPVGIIPFLIEQRAIYDFPVLFLFTLALFFLAKANFNAYIIIFLLATLSKETSFFLLIFFAIQFRNMARRKYLFWLFSQAVIYFLIRIGLMLLYKDNPGGVFEFHLYDHANRYLHSPLNTIILFGSILIIVWIANLRIVRHLGFARNSFFAIGGPTLALYFFFGVPFEIRIFLETYPSMFILVSSVAIYFIEHYAKANHQASLT